MSQKKPNQQVSNFLISIDELKEFERLLRNYWDQDLDPEDLDAYRGWFKFARLLAPEYRPELPPRPAKKKNLDRRPLLV